MKSVLRPLRDHLHFLIIVPLLIITLTWPLLPHVLDVYSMHRPLGDADVLLKFWDAWYGNLLLSESADLYFTDLLFHPLGLSLAYHNFSLPNVFVFGGLQSFLPSVNGYFLAYLLTVFANVAASYIFLRQLFAGKWIALAGAVVFSFSPYFFSHIHHPEATTLATIPLTLYAFHRGIVERRRKWLVLAGMFAGFTAFIGMYILVCLFITMGICTLLLASRRWRRQRFWLGVALTLVVAASISLVRIYPMIIDANLLNETLDKGTGTLTSTDLLVFLVNARHPLTPAVFHTVFHRTPPSVPLDGYLGLLPILLVAVGLIRSPNRRLLAPWLILFMIFAVLRLGHVLQIDGRVFSDFLLPKYHLDILAPWLTKAFWDTTFFHIGILLPLAVLSCHGMKAVLAYLPSRLHAAVVLVIVAFVAFEYYQPPISGYHRYQSQYQWIDWLAAEPDQDSIHLINLPMGRNRSKRYLYHQTLHGYPQVEGLAARTPAAAYDYIEGNLLLRAWRADRAINCIPGVRDEYKAAHAQLVADGFSHIVLHRKSTGLAQSFVDVPASYADEQVQIYRLDDLRDTCDSTASLSETLTQYATVLEQSGSIVPDEASAILAIYSIENASDLPGKRHLPVLMSKVGLLRLNVEQQFEAVDSNHDVWEYPVHNHVTYSDVIAFAYDPRAADPDTIEAYRTWLARHFQFCGRLADTKDTVMEYFLRIGFSCDLGLHSAPLAIDYDNEIQLGNLLANVDGDKLELQIIWKRLPSETHSFSIQFYDEGGNRAFGQDFTFKYDALNRHEVDFSSLEPGTYAVNLIVYKYETGASVPGTILSSQTRFERELEFMTLTVE